MPPRRPRSPSGFSHEHPKFPRDSISRRARPMRRSAGLAPRGDRSGLADREQHHSRAPSRICLSRSTARRHPGSDTAPKRRVQHPFLRKHARRNHDDDRTRTTAETPISAVRGPGGGSPTTSVFPPARSSVSFNWMLAGLLFLAEFFPSLVTTIFEPPSLMLRLLGHSLLISIAIAVATTLILQRVPNPLAIAGFCGLTVLVANYALGVLFFTGVSHLRFRSGVIPLWSSGAGFHSHGAIAAPTAVDAVCSSVGRRFDLHHPGTCGAGSGL